MKAQVYLLATLTKVVGHLAQVRVPRILRAVLWGGFASLVGADPTEAELPLREYPTWDAFFTRKLKAGLRPLSQEAYVHPADSVLIQDCMADEQIVQAKNITYSLADFLQSSDAGEILKGGRGLVYYLSPKDYHRVHLPMDGKLKNIAHVLGEVWPVNNWGIQRIPSLYVRNERVILEFENTSGTFFVVFVAALNVRKVELYFPFKSAQSNLHVNELNRDWNRELKKGDPLGCFHLGSTVVVFASPKVAQTIPKFSINTLARVNSTR